MTADGQDKEIAWVTEMADALLREILEQLSGIRLSRRPPWTPKGAGPPMDGVYGRVDGAYQMRLLFRAEPRVFQRLASNMIGAPAKDAQEVQEYATEFANVLCGRFISEIYRATKVPARFYPTQYETYPDIPLLGDDTEISTIFYASEDQEAADFSWTADSVAMLLKGENSET